MQRQNKYQTYVGRVHKSFISRNQSGTMEPDYFFFLILPLAVLVVFLVALVIYHARKEEDYYETEVKKLRKLFFSGKLDKRNFLNLRNRLKNEKIFTAESKKLLTLLSDEKIDEETYVRLRQVLEKSFRDRLDRFDESTKEFDNKEPFYASKF
jgi:hypothetical protein